MSKIIKLFTLTVVLSVFIINTNAALARYRSTLRNVCKSGKCTDYCAVEGHLIRPGESFLTNQCSRIDCNNDFSASQASCGISQGSKKGIDYSKKYPHCCP